MLTRLKAVGAAAYLVVGVAAAIVGLLPWLITGMRLPLQNLWAVDTLPEQMPIVLLPFSQYLLTFIIAMLVTGSAIAGGVARATRAHHPRFAAVAIIIGVLLVQVVATVQTAVTVASGLRDGTEADVYLVACVFATIAATLIGLLLLVLIYRAPAAVAVLAISMAAVALSPWLQGILLPPGLMATAPNPVLLAIVRWVPALIVGLAVTWSGLHTIGRVVGALLSLLALWIGPALFTAVSAAVGTRILARYPAEMAEYGAQVFVSALDARNGSLSILVPAIVVTILGLTARWAIRENRARETALVGPKTLG